MPSGWKNKNGRPATLDMEFFSDETAMLRALRDETPVKSGRLAASWHLGPDGISFNRKGDGFTIRNQLPYAHIQDKGGTIPARRAVNARVMHFFYNGEELFRQRVGPSRIPPQNFVRRAVLRAFDNNKLFKVRWGKHGGQRRG